MIWAKKVILFFFPELVELFVIERIFLRYQQYLQSFCSLNSKHFVYILVLVSPILASTIYLDESKIVLPTF